MADKVKLVQAQDFQLSGGGIGLTDTSITIDDFVLPNSNTPITMSMFGDIGYITLEPETDREENISFTDIVNNGDSTSTITGVVRGLPLATTADPADYNTPDLTLRQPHSGGSLLRITNSVSLLQWFASKANEETIEERWTFPDDAGVNRPILESDTDAVLANELVTRGEVTRLIQTNFISPSIVSSSSATTGTSTAASLNWNHVSLGDNRLILVQVSTQEDVTVTGVTYNGDALTQAASHTRVTGNLRTEIWYRIAPDLGTNAIVVSTSGAAYISATALTLNDTDQTTPIGDTSDADGSSTAPSVIVTTTQDNSLVVDSLATANDPITATAGTGQAIQQEVLSSATRQIVNSVELQPNAGNTTMSYTISPSTNWAITAVEVKGITVPGIAGVNSVTGTYIDNTDPANPVSVVPLNNTTNSAPTVNDDESLGYAVDSKWYDTASGILYTCTDATNGAAVWVAVVGGTNIVTTNVTVLDDFLNYSSIPEGGTSSEIGEARFLYSSVTNDVGNPVWSWITDVTNHPGIVSLNTDNDNEVLRSFAEGGTTANDFGGIPLANDFTLQFNARCTYNGSASTNSATFIIDPGGTAARVVVNGTSAINALQYTLFGVSGSTTIPASGTWFTVKWVYASGTLSLYVNGSLITSQAGSFTSGNGCHEMFVSVAGAGAMQADMDYIALNYTVTR